MAQLGKRSRPPSMSRITSIVELGSLCDNPSVVGPGHDPAALELQQKAVAATAAAAAAASAAAAATATASSGRARKQRQTQAQHTNRRSTGSAAANSGLCCWPPAAFASGTGLAHGAGVGGGTVGFAGAAIAALEPAQFLRACGLCNRRLGPGKDTYMYRGDMAFCSTDCRDLRIAYDERGATCSLASGVPQATAAATTTAAAGSKAARTAA